MYLVTVDPIEQHLEAGTVIFCKTEKNTMDAAKKLAPIANNNVILIWKLIEKNYIGVTYKIDAYLVTDKGEVIPK